MILKKNFQRSLNGHMIRPLMFLPIMSQEQIWPWQRLLPPKRPGERPVVHDIAHSNLEIRADRIRHIRHLINLSGLFKTLGDIVRLPDAEFEKLNRNFGTVEIAGHSIVKAYTCVDKHERLDRLLKVYCFLGARDVPNVDKLMHTFDTSVVLTPRICSSPEFRERTSKCHNMCAPSTRGSSYRSPTFSQGYTLAKRYKKPSWSRKMVHHRLGRCSLPPNKSSTPFQSVNTLPQGLWGWARCRSRYVGGWRASILPRILTRKYRIGTKKSGEHSSLHFFNSMMSI